MSGNPFYIVDVFTKQKYAGNQLAVVRNGHLYTDAEMQQIAREFNFSETAFIPTDDPTVNGYEARYFTPTHEIPFAGHPTLGTVHIIQKEIIGKQVPSITLSLKAGRIPVTITYEGNETLELRMKQMPPTFGKVIKAADMANVLGLSLSDLDERHPILEVSTGTPFIIVPLKSLAAQKCIRVDLERYAGLIRDFDAKAILTFCPEVYDPSNQLNVRMFADYYGVPEDPATGSANGCLAAYLVREEYFGEKRIDILAEQGIEIGRPSLLHLMAERNNGEIDVHVGGNAVMVARGELV